MKKIIAFLLAAVMLLSMTACQPSSSGVNAKIDPDEMSMEMGQTHSDYDGVSVQINNAFWDEEGFVLEVDWINKTLHEGVLGASYKANEKFTGKGHANHICKACSRLSAEQKAEMEAITKIINLPIYISDAQKKWLKNRTEDHRPKVRLMAKQAYARPQGKHPLYRWWFRCGNHFRCISLGYSTGAMAGQER